VEKAKGRKSGSKMRKLFKNIKSMSKARDSRK
jgi:hypothetical protein